jgi:hypothetical protein
MARSAASARALKAETLIPDEHVRIAEDCLELTPASPEEANVLRTWLRRVNGPTYSQPYLVEGPPGHFRLYVGEAAERARTARGIQ